MRYVVCIFGALIILLVACSATEPKEQQAEQKPFTLRVEDSVLINNYDFVTPQADTIIDTTGHLRAFYASLRALREQGDSTLNHVNVIHFGDSHIQGDGITSVVMRRLQGAFGNAGRGFITPHRLTKSNEAPDYRITSSGSLQSSRLIELKPDVQFGVAGVGIQAPTANHRFTINTMVKPEKTNEYLFNRITVFHDSLAPMITVAEDIMGDVGSNDVFYDFTTPLALNKMTDSVMLYTYAQDKFREGAFFGFSLENGKSGVLYHALGINGACYAHWGQYSEITRQAQALNPNLIIISLGSNEAAGYNFIEDVFYNQIDRFVKNLRSYNPHAAILLTTAPEAMRMRKRVAAANPNFEKIRNTILRYGADKGVAVFDIYQATSGAGSSKRWVDNKLMQRDRIHYTAEGYNLQGLLIYGAILDGYNKFVTSDL